MEFKWDEYVQLITDKTTTAALDQLKSVGEQAAKEGADYVVRQVKMIQKYTEQKATGQISEAEYKGLMLDLADIMKLESLRVNLGTRKLISELISTTVNIAVNCLSALIVL